MQRQKQGIREELQHVNQRRDVLREQQRQLREELRKNRTSRNVTIDNLDDEIRQLEFKLAHETNTDPRKLENDLRELNALRPKLREMGQIEAQLKETDDTRKSISARLSDCDAVLQEVRSREDAENAALDERKQQEDGGVDIPTLNAEKQEVRVNLVVQSLFIFIHRNARHFLWRQPVALVTADAGNLAKLVSLPLCLLTVLGDHPGAAGQDDPGAQRVQRQVAGVCQAGQELQRIHAPCQASGVSGATVYLCQHAFAQLL